MTASLTSKTSNSPQITFARRRGSGSNKPPLEAQRGGGLPGCLSLWQQAPPPRQALAPGETVRRRGSCFAVHMPRREDARPSGGYSLPGGTAVGAAHRGPGSLAIWG